MLSVRRSRRKSKTTTPDHLQGPSPSRRTHFFRLEFTTRAVLLVQENRPTLVHNRHPRFSRARGSVLEALLCHLRVPTIATPTEHASSPARWTPRQSIHALYAPLPRSNSMPPFPQDLCSNLCPPVAWFLLQIFGLWEIEYRTTQGVSKALSTLGLIWNPGCS